MARDDRTSSARSAATRLGLLGALFGATAGLSDLLPGRGLLWVWPGAEMLGVVTLTILGLVLGVVAGWAAARARRLADLGATPGLAFGGLVILLLALAGADTLVRRDAPLAWPDRPEDHPVLTREGRPDIVIFLLDAVRADAIHDADGAILPHAPTLAAFAEEAILFTEARSPGPWTVPTHASLFTGLSTLGHGCSAETPLLAGSLDTLAERLQEAGYRTAGLVANPWLSRERGYGQGFEIYEELWHTRDREPWIARLAHRLGLWKPLDQHRRDKGTRATLERLHELLRRTSDDEPLFVFVNLISAHPLLGAPQPWHDQCLSPTLLNSTPPVWATPQDWSDIYTGTVHLETRDLQVLRELYHGEVHYMDAQLATTFDRLREAGRFEDAWIAVTSDHGCGLGEERHYAAGWDLHDRMLDIPLLLRRPGGQGGGSLREDPVQLHDLHPTLLRAAGLTPAPPTSPADGQAMFDAPPRTHSYAAFSRPMQMLNTLWMEHPAFDRTPLDRRLLGVIEGSRKMVWSSADGLRLFDLESDPAEWTDRSESDPLTAEELAARLRAGFGGEPWEMAPRMARWSDEVEKMLLEQGTLESLRSLGYIGDGGGR